MTVPDFTVSLVCDGEERADGQWGVLLDSHSTGGILIDLGYDPEAYGFISPCCHMMFARVGGDPTNRCHGCGTPYPSLEPRFLYQGDGVARGLETYGELAGWWTEPLTAAIEASELLEQLRIVGLESNGRRSIHDTSFETRASTIEAGFGMLHRYKGTWAPSGRRVKYCPDLTTLGNDKLLGETFPTCGFRATLNQGFPH